MILDFRQIFWKDDQLPHLYDFATAYRNVQLTNYFENSVIASLVPESQADLIGVASWRLKAKRNESSTEGILRRQNGHTLLTQEGILNADFDIAVLTPRNKLHDMLNAAAGYHGQSWATAFPFFNQNFLRKAGIRPPEFPGKLTHTIYENHFIAKRDIYHEYVKDCLKPAIAFMEDHPDVFLIEDGMNYLNRKPRQEVLEYMAATGRDQYPIAPFILERLFSIWIERRNYKVIAL